MKRYFLSYNSLTKDYYLDYGCFDRNREFLGKIDEQKLAVVLKKILPLQRDVLIYAQKSLEDPLKDILFKNFKDTRVKIKFEKNLESLC